MTVRDHSAITRLEAENAALRKALAEIRLIAWAEGGRMWNTDPYSRVRQIADRALTGASPVVVLTLEEAKEIEWAEAEPGQHRCPCCEQLEESGHAPDCFLTAKIRRAEEAQ